MIDSFVLLTPILMLGVIALLGFVGCDLIFTLNDFLPPPRTFGPYQGMSRFPCRGTLWRRHRIPRQAR